MGDARQLFNWGMLDFLGFWFFCDLSFDVILKSLGDILYLNRCFDSLAIYFSLKWKKINASPVSLNPYRPLPPPSPQHIPLSSCIKIPQSFDDGVPSGYTRDSEDRQSPEATLNCCCHYINETWLQPECFGEIWELSLTIMSWQPVLGLGVTIFSEDHSSEKLGLFIRAVEVYGMDLVIFSSELVGQPTGNISRWYFFAGRQGWPFLLLLFKEFISSLF